MATTVDNSIMILQKVIKVFPGHSNNWWWEWPGNEATTVPHQLGTFIFAPEPHAPSKWQEKVSNKDFSLNISIFHGHIFQPLFLHIMFISFVSAIGNGAATTG